MKTKTNQTIRKVTGSFAAFLAMTAAIPSAFAADVFKADSADNLDQGTAWVGGFPPTAADVGVWDTAVVTANIPFLGVDTNYLGVRIGNPSVPVQIGAGGILTLGASGVDMSAATQDFTNGVDVVLGAAQTWNIANGRTMAQNGAVGGVGALLTKTGPGRLVLASATPATSNGGLTVAAGTLATRSPQAQGMLQLPGGVLTLKGNSLLDLNGFTSTSATSWGTLTNAIVVPAGETATINFPGRAVMNGSLQVTGTLNLVMSFVRGEVNGNGIWSNSPGLVNLVSEPDGSADFRIIAGVPSFQRIHIGSGINFYQAFNPPSGSGTQTIQPIGELSGDVGANLLGNPVSGRFVNWFVGGLNTDARYNGIIGNNAGSCRVTKVGTGAWTIAGVNVYNGATEIREGKLIGVTGGSSLSSVSMSVSNAATLGVLLESAPTWTGTNINFSGAATSLEINYGGALPSTTTAPFTALGNLTLNGAVSVNVKGGAWTTLGQYPLVKYTTLAGTGFPALSLASLPARVQGYLSNNVSALTIDLVVTNTLQPLSWAAGNGTWDTATANWVDASVASTTYQQSGGFGDSVLFEATKSTGDPITVTLNTSLTPATVEASGKAYTISGTGSISGTASVTKSGVGSLALSTINTYTGGTKISGGILSFSVLGNLGAASSPINLAGGTLAYSGANTVDISAGRSVVLSAGNSTIDIGANTVTYGSAIGGAGAGGLIKAGSGRLTLTGVNNYTGNTTVNAGALTLATGATIASSQTITVNAGGVLDASASGLTLTSGQSLAGVGGVAGNVTAPVGSFLKPGSSAGTLTLSNSLTLSGGNYTYDVSTNSGRDLIVVAGDLTLTSGTLTVVTSEALTNGSYRIIQYSGNLLSGVGSSGNLVISGSQAGKILRLEEVVGAINLVVETAGGSSKIWAGVGSDWDVDTSFNWNAGAAKYFNGDYVTFDDAGAGQPFVNLTAGHFPGGVTAAGTASYTLSSGTSGRVSGGGGITNSGSGTLTILTANNNTGPTVIGASATIQVGNGSTTGALGTGNVINNGALVFNQTDNRSIAGSVSGAGSLTQNGLTTLTLANNNTYNGSTTIGSGATLQIGNGGGTGTLGTGNTTDDGLLLFNRTGTYTNSGNISGNGAVSKNGAATLRLNGVNTYLGPTTNAAGALIVGAASAISPSSAFYVDGGTLNLNGNNVSLAELNGAGGTINNDLAGSTNNLTIGSDGFSTTYSGTVVNGAGVLALKKVGVGSLVLSGNNSYSGGTVVAEGQLNLNANTAGGTGGILLSNGATLFIDNIGTSGSVFPANNVTVASDATATLNSDNLANGVSGSFDSQNANAVLSLGSGLSFGGTFQQFSNFSGTVRIDLAGDFRLLATGSFVNGGDNTTFQVDGLLHNRNGTGANAGSGFYIGELTGSGTLSGATTPGTFTLLTRYFVGGKGTSSTFSGGIDGTGLSPVELDKVGAGTLTLAGTLTYDGGTVVSNGTLALVNAAEPVNSSSILISIGATLDVTGLTSVPGTLNLGGGTTNQTLGGTGLVLGSVNAVGSSVANIAPGFSVGTLTVSGTVTLAANSTVTMELDRAVGSDKLVAGTISPNGATLNVTNIGATLRSGDSFQLFTNGVSGFTVNLPATDASGLINYTWANTIASNGKITLTSGLSTNAPTLANVVSGNTLDLSWPVDHTGWTLQVQTNTLTVGLSNNWLPVAGSTATNHMIMPLNPANPAVFYRLTLP